MPARSVCLVTLSLSEARPAVAVYKGTGSTNQAANFACGPNLPSIAVDTEDCDARVNQRLFGMPFVPSAPCPGC